MLNFFGDTRYDVSVILEIRVLSIYTSKYEGNKKSLYIGNISCMTKHICCFWVGVFFNMDALKNHLKIKKCIFVVYKDIVCELKQNTSLFFVKITGSEKAQMSEEQNT